VVFLGRRRAGPAPPGVTVEARFTPTVPGTFRHIGRVLAGGWSSRPPAAPAGNDRGLTGVLIVDAAATEPAPGERILMLMHWADSAVASSWLPATRFMINGRSWPHTERLEYAQGDTVHWRVINLTGRDHPMHLHGFYFRVDARGDDQQEIVFPEDQRRMVVTETLQVTETMRISLGPHGAGELDPSLPPHAPHGLVSECGARSRARSGSGLGPLPGQSDRTHPRRAY
jgi:manganese oxidase